MEYAAIGNAALQNTALGQKMPELGRLKHVAERVAVVGDRVGAFIGRFSGQFPPPGTDGANAVVASGYRNDLDSVCTQIDRLESIVTTLESIG